MDVEGEWWSDLFIVMCLYIVVSTNHQLSWRVVRPVRLCLCQLSSQSLSDATAVHFSSDSHPNEIFIR